MNREWVAQVIESIGTWEGVSIEPHRFGGREFKLGKVEVGHIHSNGMVDIPFTRRIREVLVAENHAEHHHLLHDSGWITFYMRRPEDVTHALWLYRLSYVQKSYRRADSGQKAGLEASLGELSPTLKAAVLARPESDQ